MNYIGKEDELITRVFTKNDKDYIGIYIQTNYDTYKFCVDDFSSCCEFYGVTLFNHDNEVLFEINCESKDEKDFKLLEGFFLKQIEYCHERSKPLEFYSDETQTCSLKITLKDIELKEVVYYIDIYNQHNGYYPHIYLVEWNNYKNEGEL
jgi:hypothetical protein